MAPKTILVMRHAERPIDDNDVNLSKAGYDRAKKLVAYIPETFGKPDRIFAAANTKHSHRPLETIHPLADALDEKIHDEFKDDEYEALAEMLLNRTSYAGQLILVCWHHEKIPKLLEHLNATKGYPDPWDGTVFDLIIRLDYTGDTATVTQITEPFAVDAS